MCRLLGVVSARAASVADGLGPSPLAQFTSLARLHSDGWGMAWLTSSGALQSRTSPLSAAEDPEFGALTRQVRTRAAVAHLRWASPGLEVCAANTHPFRDGDRAFVHNGTIRPLAELDALLSDDLRRALVGTTDSERYFRLVLQHIAAADDEARGIVDAVSLLRARFPTASLNAMLLTSDRLYVVHASDGTGGPVRELTERLADRAPIPHDHLDRYFQMSYRIDQDAIRIASSGMTEPGWSPLPADSVLVVDIDSLATAVHALE